MFTSATPVDRRHSQTAEQYAATDLEVMQEARRYSAHIVELFRQYLGRRVLEVGSGIGTMSRQLVEIAELVVGIEPNPHCASRLAVAMRDCPRFSFRPCHLEDCDPQELRKHRFDTVVCINVLEHIADDVAALRTFGNVVAPDGRVLIFVPAVQAAYGPLDAELGHYRRYSKRLLAGKLAAADLEPLAVCYTNPIGLLGWMYNARISGTTAHNARQVKLFERLVAPWALPLERWIQPPIGLSLVGVGRPRRDWVAPRA